MLLDRAEAPVALLIPRCSSVHTFGMGFPLEVVFLDDRGIELERRRVDPCRVVARRDSSSVLEIPARG
jgi:hypothetical protein